MSETNDGGPAFPVPEVMETWDGGSEMVKPTHWGMTLRDYFAAKAMQAIITAGGKDPRLVAELAVQFADTLLKELE